MTEKLKETSISKKIYSCLEILLSLVVIVFCLLGIADKVSFEFGGYFALPSMTLLAILNGITLIKESKKTAIIMFSASAIALTLFILMLVKL